MARTIAAVTLAAVAAFIILALPSASAAASPAYSYLSAYISNSVLNQYAFLNVTYGGANYIVLQPTNGTPDYLLVNSTGGTYRLVSNSATANAVLSYFIPSGYALNESKVSYLRSALSNFTAQAAPNITDCVIETGTSPPFTNTYYNATLGCDTVLNCRNVLSQYGTTYFVPGLANFSIRYELYNSTINSYRSALASLNASNAGSLSTTLKTDLSNLRLSVTQLPNESIFAPQITFNPASCSTTGLNEPWYCVAIPYCSPLNMNSTLVANMASVQASLLAGVPTNAFVSDAEAHASSSSKAYLYAEAEKANASAYNSFLTAAYPLYNSTLSGMESVMARINDTNLSVSIRALESGFSNIRTRGFNQSVSSANVAFATLIENATSALKLANSSYSNAYGLARNDTEAAIAAQLNYRVSPVRLAQISSQLFAIDRTINSGKVNQTYLNTVSGTLQEMRVELAVYVAPVTMAYLTKLLTGGFATAMLSGSKASVQSKDSSAPLYSALEALIIDAVIIAVIYYFTYHRLSTRHKIRRSRAVRYAWIALFVLLAVLAVADAALTYGYAQAANAFLPFSHFAGVVSSSKSVMVALNGTSAYGNSSLVACADSIKSALSANGRNVTVVGITNGTCTSNGQISSLGLDCYDHAVSSGVPVVVLDSGPSYMAYKGIYGYNLYVSGSPADGQSCLVSSVLSKG